MAESLQIPEELPIRRPVRIEMGPDNVIIVFIDPRAFNVQFINGRGAGTTQELYTRVVISPWLASSTQSFESSHSRETDTQK